MDEIEARLDRDYDARRNPHERPFTRDELIEAHQEPMRCSLRPLIG
jgi:hypothetical protein